MTRARARARPRAHVRARVRTSVGSRDAAPVLAIGELEGKPVWARAGRRRAPQRSSSERWTRETVMQRTWRASVHAAWAWSVESRRTGAARGHERVRARTRVCAPEPSTPRVHATSRHDRVGTVGRRLPLMATTPCYPREPDSNFLLASRLRWPRSRWLPHRISSGGGAILNARGKSTDNTLQAG